MVVTRAPRGASLRALIAGTMAIALPLAAQNNSDGFASPPAVSSVPRSPPGLIFFPTFPPALDTAINRNQPSPSGSTAAPPGLAPYVSEIFYAQLGSQLHAGSLNGKLREQLSTYRTAKLALLQELRAAIAAMRETDARARRVGYETLARRQEPRLAELEKNAERLRIDLIAPDRNWNDYREWWLGDKDRRGYSPIEIAQVMRAYAFYHKGLLPAQRRLLREISAELALAVESSAKSIAAATTVFFSPETARVTLPDLSAEVSAKLAAYLTKKSVLKKELYDAISKSDGKVSLFNHPLKSLAETQAALLAQLEVLAEEIRSGLGPVATPPDALARSPIPSSVVERLTTLVQDRNVLQQDATGKIESIVARTRAERVRVSINYAFENDRLRFTVYPGMRGAPPAGLAKQMDAIRSELNAVAETYGRGLAELVNTRDGIRREVGEILGLKETGPIDMAMASALRAASQRESETAYRDYRIAVFEPGLSPAQRRLLFDGAIEQLGLPLPRGEMQPARRANSW